MAKTIRWGILGPGGIAHSFAQGLQAVKDAQLVAVGSRSKERSKAFAKEFGVPRAYGSYEELVNDPEVDVIYISTVHPTHYESAMLCLRAGKSILCEKPFAMDAKQSEEVIALARKSNLFAMEAMWTRFLPAHVKVREWMEAGRIGEVRMLRAEFGFHAGFDPEGRLFNPMLAGGALLDVGIYPVSYASLIFGGQPKSIQGAVHMGQTGVDERFELLFSYEGGRMATLASATTTRLENSAWIYGTKGYIRVDSFFNSRRSELYPEEGKAEIFAPDYAANGYNFEAEEVCRLLREGKTESAVMPQEETIAIMHTMDEIRGQWNLRYPFEK